jgi:hypothetical protein
MRRAPGLACGRYAPDHQNYRDEIVKIDKTLGIAWILLPPDPSLGGFRGISPRIMNEEKFVSAKKKSEKEKD